MTSDSITGKKVVLVGQLYEDTTKKNDKRGVSGARIPTVEMGKFLLSIPKDLRRKIKFESDEKGFKNASAYICHILQQRHLTFFAQESE